MSVCNLHAVLHAGEAVSSAPTRTQVRAGSTGNLATQPSLTKDLAGDFEHCLNSFLPVRGTPSQWYVRTGPIPKLPIVFWTTIESMKLRFSRDIFKARESERPTSGPVLILHDTTEFTYKREKSEAIGKTRINIAGAYRDSTPRFYTACGILMHSSLAVTTDGLPLGLTSIRFWSREKFKGTSRLKRHINPTRVPIEEKESIRWLESLAQSTRLLREPERCVHIGDRESDIYELFCKAQDLGTQFLFRTCVDRLAGDGTVTVSAQMEEVRCKGVHRVAVRDQRGNVTEVVLELRYQKIHVLAPLYKQGRYPPLDLTVLHATERGKPKGRDPIDWKLITNLPVTSRAQAIEKLQWYALRWKIEVFHKILKSGCQAEQSKLRTAERLVNLLAMLCILSWRIFWLTMINRVAPDAKASLAFTGL